MKTTIEIPDDLFRRSKAEAALRGESLKDLVTAALQTFLDRRPASAPQGGWRSVFGQARRGETQQVDAVVAAELETVDPDDWR